LFLFPSLEESFGVALLEAMSSGVNFVASNIGGIPEVAGDELKSCLFNPADIKGMAEYGIKLLNDKTLSSKYSKLSRERVKNTFSTDKVSNLYLDLYKSFF
jgi:glycosyltransferase involved in cell wall biosynthesis